MFGRRFPRRRWLWFGLAPLLAAGAIFVPWRMAFGFPGGWHGGACGDHGPGADKLGFMVEHVKKVANLDETQSAAVDAVLADAGPRLADLRAEGEALREAMHAALAADDVDTREVERLRKDGIDLADRASREGLDALMRVREVLTPEQRATVRDLIERFHEPGR
jgi:Spy/CpxP family protein refolding chaperone